MVKPSLMRLGITIIAAVVLITNLLSVPIVNDYDLLGSQTVFAQLQGLGKANNDTALVVINIIDDDLGGYVEPSDFSMIVGNLNSTNTTGLRITQTLDFVNGSESGNSIQMMPGSFFVRDNSLQSKPITRIYNTTFSGDCLPFFTSTGTLIGIGNTSANQISTCNVERTLITD